MTTPWVVMTMITRLQGMNTYCILNTHAVEKVRGVAKLSKNV